MPNESRILRVPHPINPRAFNGVVKPAAIRRFGSQLGVREPERGETTPLPAQRVESARQWCVRQNSTQALQCAEILVEQHMRLHAIRAMVEQKVPEGEMKVMLRKLFDGKLIAIQV